MRDTRPWKKGAIVRFEKGLETFAAVYGMNPSQTYSNQDMNMWRERMVLTAWSSVDTLPNVTL